MLSIVSVVLVVIAVSAMVALLVVIVERFFREFPRLGPVAGIAWALMTVSLVALMLLDAVQGFPVHFATYGLAYAAFWLIAYAPIGLLMLHVRKKKGWALGPPKQDEDSRDRSQGL